VLDTRGHAGGACPHRHQRDYRSPMAEIASSVLRIREGEAALARGAWHEARAIFEEAL
jgi:hypothetical protein